MTLASEAIHKKLRETTMRGRGCGEDDVDSSSTASVSGLSEFWSGDNRDVEVSEVHGVEIGLERQEERQRERGRNEVGTHRKCEQRQTEIKRNDALPLVVGGLLKYTQGTLKEFRFVVLVR
jgi:hypothetical protein